MRHVSVAQLTSARYQSHVDSNGDQRRIVLDDKAVAPASDNLRKFVNLRNSASRDKRLTGPRSEGGRRGYRRHPQLQEQGWSKRTYACTQPKILDITSDSSISPGCWLLVAGFYWLHASKITHERPPKGT